MTKVRYLVLTLFFTLTDCTDQEMKPAPPSATERLAGRHDLRPVVGTPPYWCDLVSKEALVRVSGANPHLAEIRSPEESAGQKVCGVRDTGMYGPLGVTWLLKNGGHLLDSSLEQVDADHPQRLPARFGSGFVVYSPRTSHLPYQSGSLFQCGPYTPWIYLALRHVAPGRDVVADLTGLMRIAQQRFGAIHRCTPRPVRRF